MSSPRAQLAVQPPALRVKFRGVRGGIPVADPAFMRHGGNTACVEIASRDYEGALIIDAGTGIRSLGLELDSDSKRERPIDILLTHLHWDHIQGLPFFAPLFTAGRRITLHTHFDPLDARRLLAKQMSSPFFPVHWADLCSRIDVREVLAGETFAIGPFQVTPFALFHPGGATGYRVETEGARVVHAADHEHGDFAIDASVLDAARGADLLIYDAQYTPAEYEAQRGWGHSTWEAGARLAREAGAAQLALFHHDPQRDDDALDAVVNEAAARFAETFAASERNAVAIRAR